MKKHPKWGLPRTFFKICCTKGTLSDASQVCLYAVAVSRDETELSTG